MERDRRSLIPRNIHYVLSCFTLPCWEKAAIFWNYNDVPSIKTKSRFHAEYNEQTLTLLLLLHLHRLYWKRHLGRRSSVWRSCENKGAFLEEKSPFGSQASQRGSNQGPPLHGRDGHDQPNQGQGQAGKHGLGPAGERLEMQNLTPRKSQFSYSALLGTEHTEMTAVFLLPNISFRANTSTRLASDGEMPPPLPWPPSRNLCFPREG